MEVIKKRINTLTKTVVIVFILAIIYFLHKKDFHDQLERFKLINSLTAFVADPPKINDGMIEQSVAFKYLELYGHSNRVKGVLYSMFEKLGFRMKRKLGQLSHFTQEPDYMLISTGSKKLTEIENIGQLENPNVSVSDAVNYYLYYHDPVDLKIATGVDTTIALSEVINSFHSIYESIESNLKSGKTKGDSVVTDKGWKYSLSDKKIIETCFTKLIEAKTKKDVTTTFLAGVFQNSAWNLNAMSQGDTTFLYMAVASSHWHPLFVGVPVKVEQVKITPAEMLLFSRLRHFFFLGPTLPQFDFDELDDLKNYYGDLSLEKAKAVIEEDYLKVYKSINILGFEFSTRNFPYVLQFFCSLVLLSLFFSIKHASGKNESLFVKDVDDDIFEIYVNRKILRLICWVALPLVTAFACLPLQILTVKIISLFVVWALLNGVLGFASYRMSLKMSSK